jgi:orotidine-5'-phosphate decarboxylase
MNTSVQSSRRSATAAERIIVALDVQTSREARDIVSELKGSVGAFKIGLQLFTAAGPAFVRELSDAGAKVFLDLKFHDIPNTVAKAGIEAARLGVWMFNVHALGGREMMSRAAAEVAEFCDSNDVERPRIIAVTVLTSSNANTLRETGIEGAVEQQVLNLAKLAAECNLDGVVASPLEAAGVRSSIDDPDFLIVTPGVRPEFATNDDQKRVTTPAAATSNGADYLVIGRPILHAGDWAEAIGKICGEIEAALH